MDSPTLRLPAAEVFGADCLSLISGVLGIPFLPLQPKGQALPGAGLPEALVIGVRGATLTDCHPHS